MDIVESGFAHVLLLIGFATGIGLPNGMPPGPEDPVMMRVAPPQCVFYTSWAGMVQPDAKSSNHTEQLLAEPQVQQSLQRWRQFLGTVAGRLGDLRGPETAAAAKDAEEIGRLFLSRPGAVFVTSARRTPRGLDFHGGAIANLGDDAQRVQGMLEKHQRVFFGHDVQPIKEGNATWRRFRRPDGLTITFGTKDKYLIFGIGEGAAEGIVQRMGANPPQWLAGVHQRIPVSRRATTTYVQIDGIRDFLASWMGQADTRRIMDAVGFSNVRFMATVTGLDSTGFVSRSFTDIQGQPQGLFTAGAQQALQPADLAPVPEDAITAVVFRGDAGQLWDSISAVLLAVSPPGYEQFAAHVNELGKRANLDFHRDVAPALGGTWYVYDMGPKQHPGTGQATIDRPGVAGHFLSGVTFVATVRNAQQLNKVREQLVRAIEGGQESHLHRTESQVNGHKIVEVRLGDQPDARSFAWSLTDRELIVSPSVDNVRAHLARTPQSPSLANIREVKDLFQAGGAPVAIAYQDTPRVFDRVYSNLESVARVLEAAVPAKNGRPASLLPPSDVIRRHLQPTIAAVRWSQAGLDSFVHQTLPGANAGISGPIVLGSLLGGARLTGNVVRRDASEQNLRQIAAALVEYQRVNNQFPPAAIPDQQGRALLSWRVLILPTLGQEALYRQFHLNESWDSPHNRQLIAKMPNVFRSPLSKAEAGRTNYLAVTGVNTIFSSQPPASLANLGEQASRTVLVVEANDRSAAIWTQPSDFQVNLAAPAIGLLEPGRNGFLAALADGTVRFISERTEPQALVAMFTAGQQAPLTARRPGQQTNGQQTPAAPVQPPIRR